MFGFIRRAVREEVAAGMTEGAIEGVHRIAALFGVKPADVDAPKAIEDAAETPAVPDRNKRNRQAA